MTNTLWCLRTPSGAYIAETADVDRSECWAKAFNFLSYTDEDWRKRYWKRWSAAQESARRRGYRIVRGRFAEADHEVVRKGRAKK